MAKTRAWNVYNRHGKLIDTVFYTVDCDADYVLRSLINHDGYNHDIRVSHDDGKTRFHL